MLLAVGGLVFVAMLAAGRATAAELQVTSVREQGEGIDYVAIKNVGRSRIASLSVYGMDDGKASHTQSLPDIPLDVNQVKTICVVNTKKASADRCETGTHAWPVDFGIKASERATVRKDGSVVAEHAVD